MRDTDNIMAGELQKSQVCVSKQFAIASQEEKKKEAHKLLRSHKSSLLSRRLSQPLLSRHTKGGSRPLTAADSLLSLECVCVCVPRHWQRKRGKRKENSLWRPQRNGSKDSKGGKRPTVTVHTLRKRQQDGNNYPDFQMIAA